MGSSNSREMYRNYPGSSGAGGAPPMYPAGYEIQEYDYSRWGYIILYLVILLFGIVLNALFVWTIRQNRPLHRTAHILLASLACRDLVTAVFVVPFVIDSQAVHLMKWQAGDALCKMFSFLNVSTMCAHSFLLVFTLIFLYFWYRKQEAYVNEQGQTIVRKNKAHKWVIPLAWVLALGLAIPAGALAEAVFNTTLNTQTCSVWDGRRSDSGYWVLLAIIIVCFFVPLVILVFPVIALLMQLCGAREPRLDPPHSRTALTGVGLFIIWLATRAPYEIFTLLKLVNQSAIGRRTTAWTGTPYAVTSFETDVIINALIYVAIVLNPLLYFTVNPDYRTGVKNVWKNMYCNKDPALREHQEQEKRLKRLQKAQYRNNRAPQNMRMNQEQLLPQRAPQIVGSQMGVQYQPYPQQAMQPQNQFLMPNQQFMDMSFERVSPQLPPVFEYDGLKYIDTARVEPRIGYSPEKTPPAPATPEFKQKPFQIPIVANQPRFIPQNESFEMTSISPQPPIATSEPKRESFHLENLDNSPGSTLRTRRHKEQEDLDESLEVFENSPGSKHRRRTQESGQSSGFHSTNGTGISSSRPTTPSLDRPSSRLGVEIVIQGRTRSRTDLCPDIPRSKFEHSV